MMRNPHRDFSLPLIILAFCIIISIGLIYAYLQHKSSSSTSLKKSSELPSQNETTSSVSSGKIDEASLDKTIKVSGKIDYINRYPPDSPAKSIIELFAKNNSINISVPRNGKCGEKIIQTVKGLGYYDTVEAVGKVVKNTNSTYPPFSISLCNSTNEYIKITKTGIPIDWILYENGKYKYRLYYPPEWNISSEDSQKLTLAYDDKILTISQPNLGKDVSTHDAANKIGVGYPYKVQGSHSVDGYFGSTFTDSKTLLYATLVKNEIGIFFLFETNLGQDVDQIIRTFKFTD